MSLKAAGLTLGTATIVAVAACGGPTPTRSPSESALPPIASQPPSLERPSPVSPDQPRASTTPSASTASASVLWERNVGPVDRGVAYPWDHQWDPMIAVDPADPKTMVVAYVEPKAELVGRCGSQEVAIGLRRTADGGMTWRDTAAGYWREAGLCTSIHPSLAWGPGPRPGSFRLYFADTSFPCGGPGLCVIVSYSDDAGDTWSAPYVNRPPSVLRGGVPDVTTDRNPASPNFGAVYVVYNWQPYDPSPLWRAKGGQAYHGLRLLTSRDFGRTWTSVELDPAPRDAAHAAGYLISPGARVQASPDGAVYVAFNQLNLAPSFDVGWTTAAGSRWEYAVERLMLGRDGRVTKSPTVSAITLATRTQSPGFLPIPGIGRYLDVANGLAVDPVSGRVYLAIDDYDSGAAAGVPRGRVRVGRSSDHGRTWQWTMVPDLPRIAGRLQSSLKATIAVSPAGDRVFVGFHGLTDVPNTASPGSVTVGNDFAVSADGGVTFSAPIDISAPRWNTEWVAGARNVVGLRDRAVFVSDTTVAFVYGDGRNAGLPGTSVFGNSDVYGTLIELR